MRKIIYIILIAFLTSLTATSCTEENIEPTGSLPDGGGGGAGNTGPI
jgi:hypothetical protein